MTRIVRPPIRSALILQKAMDAIRPRLERECPEIAFSYAYKLEDVPELLETARPEAVYLSNEPGYSGDAFRQAIDFPSVKWAHVAGSGYNHLLPIPDRLVLTNGQGVLAPFLAETVIGMMLALNRRLLEYRELQERREWRYLPWPTVHGRTLLIVGLGAIGVHVARLAKALGMRVHAIKRTPISDPNVDRFFSPDQLHEALPTADVVSLHVRLTDETRHMIDKAAFDAMKPGVIFMNTARGSVVDEDALVNALSEGKIGGAHLDVFTEEPLSAESPLWGFKNVILTPHDADGVDDWPDRLIRGFIENIRRWNSGEPLVNLIEERPS